MEPESHEKSALARALPRYAAPPDLRARVVAAVRSDQPVRERPRPAAARSWLTTLRDLGRALTVGAAVAAAMAVGFLWGDAHRRQEANLDDAISNHIRALETGHVADVASTDQHTVKPWFAGKLDFSPPVFDLAAEGFPLAAGRLERLNDHAAAALIFHRRLHTLTLYIWPATPGSVPAKTEEQAGYHATAWSTGGFNFIAVSDVAPGDLEQFAAAYRAQSGSR